MSDQLQMTLSDKPCASTGLSRAPGSPVSLRAISLTQPWATLVALGEKQYETRSWPTNYRGRLAIHAAKGFPRDCWMLCQDMPFADALRRHGIRSADALPLGCIIAVCDLTACKNTTIVEERLMVEDSLPDECEFGDYSAGRFAFALENVVALKTPVPCRGALSIWSVPDEIASRVLDLANTKLTGASASGPAKGSA